MPGIKADMSLLLFTRVVCVSLDNSLVSKIIGEVSRWYLSLTS